MQTDYKGTDQTMQMPSLIRAFDLLSESPFKYVKKLRTNKELENKYIVIHVTKPELGFSKPNQYFIHLDLKVHTMYASPYFGLNIFVFKISSLY